MRGDDKMAKVHDFAAYGDEPTCATSSVGRTHLSPGKARVKRRASPHRKTNRHLQPNIENTGYA